MAELHVEYKSAPEPRCGITSDPNDREDPEKIVGQVVTVSLETVRIVRALPELEEVRGPRWGEKRGPS